MDKIYFGVDIGGTAIKFGVFTPDGELLDKWEISTDKSDNGTRILPSVANEILRYVGNPDKVLAVGIGIPGPVQQGGYVTRCVNLGLGDFNPARELAALLHGVPVFAGNDANVAALGEAWKGGGMGARSMVLITLGTGVGGGIIVDGNMIFGAGGMGGEIGHVVVDPTETLSCNCGQFGCLDQIASATGIVRSAQRMLDASDAPSALRNEQPLTAKAVLDAAKSGDALALEAFTRCMHFLAKSMAIMTNMIDPEAFIIGGGVSKAGDFLVDVLRKQYELAPTLFDRKANIVLAQLGNDAGICGAARLAMNSAH